MSKSKEKSSENCILLGCKQTEGTSYHQFPKEPALKRVWVNFVFKDRIDSPTLITERTRLCSEHFTPDCFTNFMQKAMGFADKYILKSNAVPTVYSQSSTPGSQPGAADIRTKKDFSCQYNYRPDEVVRTRNTGVQCFPQMPSKNVSVQCNALFWPKRTRTVGTQLSTLKFRRNNDETEGFWSNRLDEDYINDSTPTHTTNGFLEDHSSIVLPPPKPVKDVSKYLVYEECLLGLFQYCPSCKHTCQVKKFVRGTYLSITQQCFRCDFSRKWNSQPLVGSQPAGNLHMSGAIVFTGASFAHVKKFLDALKVRSISKKEHYRNVRSYMDPSINVTWKKHQAELLEELKHKEVVTLGGDMRAASPGHCAKYGSYTMMDMESMKVIDVQLVQSNEVDDSNHMQKEGLDRSLTFLDGEGVTVNSLITDRHVQVEKYMSEQRAGVQHRYGVWHVTKSVSKKLDVVARKRGCEKIKAWQKSLISHMFWAVTTSSSGPEMVAKWVSVLNHVQNIHSHSNTLFPRCLHGPLTERQSSKWLSPASKASARLEEILGNASLLKDVAKLSPHHQTWAIDGFHSLILKFAPKKVVFSHRRMMSRLYLSALYFNENAKRPRQVRTQQGKLVKNICFPKSKNGKYSVHVVKKNPTYEYVEKLLTTLLTEAVSNGHASTAELDQVPFYSDIDIFIED